MGWVRAILLLAALGLSASAAAAPPERIVSTHLCADQLLLLMAKPERIAALSYFADDPNLSALAKRATPFRRTRGLAEEILPLRPDLVIVGAFTARPTTLLLRRLGMPVLPLPVAETFGDVRRNIRTLAEAIGEPEAGEALVARFDREVAAALPKAYSPGDPPVAALYWSRGYVPASASLAGEAVRAAGFSDLAARLGLPYGAVLPVESMLWAAPDLFVLAERGAPAMADLPMRHRALRRAYPGETAVRLHDRLWNCGAPAVAEAVARLAERRRALP